MVIKVAVHDGKFHADDVFSVALLEILFKKVDVIRTRDIKEMKKCDFRVDVGLQYDPEDNNFDHHQEDSPVRDNGIPYASFGLLWKEYGRKMVKTDEDVEHFDKSVVQAIDADDNGKNLYDNIEINPYTLSKIVNSMNPSWIDKNQDYNKNFKQAVRFAKKIIKTELKKLKSFHSAKKIVEKAIKQSDKEYIVLEKSCPWRSYEFDEKIKYVVYPAFNNTWGIQGVPKEKGSMEVRKKFPKSWRGLIDKDLEKVNKIKGSKFCHKSGFLSITKTKTAAIKLVEKALEN